MSGMLRSDDPWSTRPAPEETRNFDERDQSGGRFREKPTEGVDAAYRIADENMRGGQWRAGPRNQQGYDWRSAGYGYRSAGYGSMPFGLGYNSPFGYGYGGRSFDGLLEQIIRTYMDMIGLVGTMMNGLSRPAYPRPFESRREAEPRYGPDSVQRGRSAAVRIEVMSNQPNQIAVDLRALPPLASLSVAPLRALNHENGELHDVRIDTESDRYVLRVRIPDAQPVGLYSAAIIETRSGEPYGTLAIQVGRSSPDRARARSSKKL
jgi:hypothetical protein